MMSLVTFKRLTIGICFVALASVQLHAEPPALLRMFGRKSQTEQSKSYELTAEEGPWLILASTFVGEGAKERAEKLVTEIRSDLKLPAYYYKEKFDFTGKLGSNDVRGRARYANQYEYEAYAVLVGEYDTAQHPSVEADLQRIKSATPDVFKSEKEMEKELSLKTPVTTLKVLHRKLVTSQKDKAQTPMVSAFLTRNPLLPKEYFDQPVVDSFVRQLNEGWEHSLLECDGKFTVVVCTFQGLGAIVDGRQEKKFVPSLRRLDQFAEDANKACLELRKNGVEAYQYHDRNRSLVTVGSFDSLGRDLPDGRFEYARDIMKVVKEYNAFNVDPMIARQVSSTKGMAANNIANIPFDVKPTPIAVPRASKGSLYRAFGMR